MKPCIARLAIDDLINPIKTVLGYTVNTWSGHEAHEIVVRVTEYVLGTTPGGLALLEQELIQSWGVAPDRARSVICHALFPLDAVLKPYAERIAEHPSTVKLSVSRETLRIEIYPISTGEKHE